MADNFSKSSAQARVDQINAFRAEVELLENNDILELDQDQLSAIDTYHEDIISKLTETYDVDVSLQGKRLTLGMQVASFLGALALAAAVFFLFYQYWGYFNTVSQVFILVAAPIVSLVATHILREKEQTGYYAKLMALISFACFVLNISMFGQIFNLKSSDNALLIWCFYALFLAYAYDIRLLLAMAIFSFYAFVAARVGVWCGLYWLSMGSHPENFILPALILFVIPSLFSHSRMHGFEVIYRVLAQCGLLLAVLVLAFYGRASYLDWDVDIIEGMYQVLGFAISAGFIAIGIKKHWPAVMNTGNVFFVIFLYTKLFEWWWDWLPKYLFFFLIGLSAILILMIFKRLRSLQQVSTETGAAHG